MHLEFAYTPDDFREMYNKAPLVRSRGHKVLRGVTVWLIFIGFAIAAYRKFSAPPGSTLEQIRCALALVSHIYCCLDFGLPAITQLAQTMDTNTRTPESTDAQYRRGIRHT